MSNASPWAMAVFILNGQNNLLYDLISEMYRDTIARNLHTMTMVQHEKSVQQQRRVVQLKALSDKDHRPAV